MYFAMIDKERVPLLCGAVTNEKQAADIERALECLRDYKERSGTS